MAVEIERKFLMSAVPDWLADCESTQISQGYIALDDETEVRIRKRADAHSLTVKRGGGLAREEIEIELDADRFARLWPLTEGRRVVKRRHLVPAGELRLEVDVYEEDLAGLAVAEVEFASVARSEAFEPPGWLDREVTDDPRYKNRSLAERGLPPD